MWGRHHDGRQARVHPLLNYRRNQTRVREYDRVDERVYEVMREYDGGRPLGLCVCPPPARGAEADRHARARREGAAVRVGLGAQTQERERARLAECGGRRVCEGRSARTGRP